MYENTTKKNSEVIPSRRYRRRDNNSIKKSKSFLSYCMWSGYMFAILYAILVKRYPFYIESKLQVVLIILASISAAWIIGCVFFRRKFRNYISVVVAGAIPTEIIYAFGCFHTGWQKILFALGIGGVLGGIYIIRNRKKGLMVGVGGINLVVMVMAVLMLIPYGNVAESYQKDYKLSTYDKKKTFDANIEVMEKLLDPEIWNTLNAEDRKEVIKTAMVADANELGIPECTIEYCKMDEYIAGRTNYEGYSISLNEQLLKKDMSLLAAETIFHETFHLYQHRVVDAYKEAKDSNKGLLIYREAEYWTRDISDYIDAKESTKPYENQRLESDAREHSEKVIEKVAYKVDMYRKGKVDRDDEE